MKPANEEFERGKLQKRKATKEGSYKRRKLQKKRNKPEITKDKATE